MFPGLQILFRPGICRYELPLMIRDNYEANKIWSITDRFPEFSDNL